MFQIRNYIPDEVLTFVKKHFAFISPKPYVLKDGIKGKNKFPNGEKGGVVITADFELAWAVRYSKRDVDPVEMAKTERANIPIILDLCDEYNIPITWATVGHLFLESCNAEDHAWMSRIPYFDTNWKFQQGDWFDHDPHTDYLKNPEWYAPDLIRSILDRKVDHEMSCHTFSHINCKDEICPPNVVDDELKACYDVAQKWGLGFTSLAFPGGTAGNYAILKKHGIKIYRKRIGKYEVAYPYRDEFGLLVSPTGPSIGAIRDGWSLKREMYRYKKAIHKAVRHNSLVHLWFHPSADKSAFQLLLPEIFKLCNAKRMSGELWIGTMHSLQEYINKNNIV